MVVVAFGKNELAGGWPLCLFPDRRSSPADKEGAGKISCQGKLVYSIKEALCLCMDIHMHEFLARFIFFNDMLIKQVRTLQDTNMDQRDYII